MLIQYKIYLHISKARTKNSFLVKDGHFIGAELCFPATGCKTGRDIVIVSGLRVLISTNQPR